MRMATPDERDFLLKIVEGHGVSRLGHLLAIKQVPKSEGSGPR